MTLEWLAGQGEDRVSPEGEQRAHPLQPGNLRSAAGASADGPPHFRGVDRPLQGVAGIPSPAASAAQHRFGTPGALKISPFRGNPLVQRAPVSPPPPSTHQLPTPPNL